MKPNRELKKTAGKHEAAPDNPGAALAPGVRATGSAQDGRAGCKDPRSKDEVAAAQRPDVGKWRAYYEQDRRKFFPIKAPPGWTRKKDIDYYLSIWDKRNDYGNDVDAILSENLAELHDVLDLGIAYFLKKRGFSHDGPRLSATLQDKIELFTQLLPESKNPDYTLRFTTDLARITWLESERRRIQKHKPKWFLPYYHVADCFLDATFELRESLECEHKDFPAHWRRN